MSTFQFVPATEEQKAKMQIFRDKYEALDKEIREAMPEASRSLSLALVHLEESAMWLNKSITKND